MRNSTYVRQKFGLELGSECTKRIPALAMSCVHCCSSSTFLFPCIILNKQMHGMVQKYSTSVKQRTNWIEFTSKITRMKRGAQGTYIRENQSRNNDEFRCQNYVCTPQSRITDPDCMFGKKFWQVSLIRDRLLKGKSWQVVYYNEGMKWQIY